MTGLRSLRPAAVPMVVRAAASRAPAGQPLAIPLKPLGETYISTQECVWLDAEHFAVGRWDGSLSLFSFTEAPLAGPKIARAVNSPAQEGIQMITALPGSGAFLSSNDDDSMAIWRTSDGSWCDLDLAAELPYDPVYGSANSGAVVDLGDGERWFVAGHAAGWLTLWRAASAFEWILTTSVDVRAPTPVNPYDMHNIRGIAALPGQGGFGFVVTGSEDGNLTVVRIPDGKVMSTTVYNPTAKFGINSLSACGVALLVANCAEGSEDSNLWAYEVDPSDWSITCTGKANLMVTPAPQVFNFDVVSALWNGRVRFFCSTQQGAVWMGELDDAGAPQMAGYVMASPNLGSAVAWQGAAFVAAGTNILEFEVTDAGG